jgi:hypothetical protein
LSNVFFFFLVGLSDEEDSLTENGFSQVRPGSDVTAKVAAAPTAGSKNDYSSTANAAGTAPVTSTSSQETVASFSDRLLINIVSPLTALSPIDRFNPRLLKSSSKRILGFNRSCEDGRTAPKKSRVD